MNRHNQWDGTLLAGSVVLALTASSSLAQAQVTAHGNTIAAPDYGSGTSAGALSNGNFNTPESDGRPGVKFFAYGERAFRKGD